MSQSTDVLNIPVIEIPLPSVKSVEYDIVYRYVKEKEDLSHLEWKLQLNKTEREKLEKKIKQSRIDLEDYYRTLSNSIANEENKITG